MSYYCRNLLTSVLHYVVFKYLQGILEVFWSKVASGDNNVCPLKNREELTLYRRQFFCSLHIGSICRRQTEFRSKDDICV